MSLTRRPTPRTPVGRRVAARGFRDRFAGLTRQSLPREVVAGITLLAIAIPEQLATSRLAGVPAFLAMIAFIAGTLAFLALGANPIMSVGADSTIAPLFAVALAHLAATGSPIYIELVAMTAVVTGLLVAAIGLLRLGWMADLLSRPIITGFMGGIGLIIIVHQLPDALGIPGGGESLVGRLHVIASQLGQVHGWPLALALGTVLVMVIGDHVNARLPWALVAVVAAVVLTAALSLSHHGVAELGTVVAGAPVWRLRWLSLHQWGQVVTIALTLMVVVISQSAMTSRVSSEEIGAGEDLSRDFVGVGAANVAAGLLGSFPVDASPPRTLVVGMAGGRTRLAGLVAGLGMLVLTPFAAFAHVIPLPVLAGVLFFIAGRLIKVRQLGAMWRAGRSELAVAVASALGVLLLGVELGLAIAVGLAILLRTWRSARPRMLELGRRAGTTSWEPLNRAGVEPVPGVLAVLFDESLYFANAGAFRLELHRLLGTDGPDRHVVVDAVAMSEIDYSALVMLADVVRDLAAGGNNLVVARANDAVRRQLTVAGPPLSALALYESVDDAVAAVAGAA